MNFSVSSATVDKVKNVAKSFADKPLLYASKGIGVLATSAVLYDAHKYGVERAIVKDDIDTANRVYRQHRQMTICDTNSATVANMKNFWYEMQQAFPLNHSTSKVLGYLSGFGMTIAKNIPVLALSALSIFPFKNQTISKVAGSLLAAYGAKVVCSDVLAVDDKSKLVS